METGCGKHQLTFRTDEHAIPHCFLKCRDLHPFDPVLDCSPLITVKVECVPMASTVLKRKQSQLDLIPYEEGVYGFDQKLESINNLH